MNRVIYYLSLFAALTGVVLGWNLFLGVFFFTVFASVTEAVLMSLVISASLVLFIAIADIFLDH